MPAQDWSFTFCRLRNRVDESCMFLVHVRLARKSTRNVHYKTARYLLSSTIGEVCTVAVVPLIIVTCARSKGRKHVVPTCGQDKRTDANISCAIHSSSLAERRCTSCTYIDNTRHATEQKEPDACPLMKTGRRVTSRPISPSMDRSRSELQPNLTQPLDHHKNPVTPSTTNSGTKKSHMLKCPLDMNRLEWFEREVGSCDPPPPRPCARTF